MVKHIVRNVFFLNQPSEPATKDDLQVGRDLQDTLKANRERCVDFNWKKQRQKLTGWKAQIVQHEIDHVRGIVI